MHLITDISNKKKRLIEKAKKSGIYENFGQKEVQELKDNHNYSSLIYGTQKERYLAELIETFDYWCMNFDLSQLNHS